MQILLDKEKDLQLEYKIILHFKSLFDFFSLLFTFKVLSNRKKIRYELGWDNLCTVNLLGQNIPGVWVDLFIQLSHGSLHYSLPCYRFIYYETKECVFYVFCHA